MGSGTMYEAISKYSIKVYVCEQALEEIIESSKDPAIKKIAREALKNSKDIKVDFTFL